MTDNTTQMKVHRLYTKASLFEVATSGRSLLEAPPEPILDLKITANSNPQAQEKELHEAILTIEITAKHQECLLWRVQYQHAGLYTLTGFTEEAQKRVLQGFCMNQLYPYVCAEVNRLVTQGGFLPVYLNPINFEAEQQKAAQQSELEKTSIKV
jgi:preprotein translocase subunit SecB